MPQGDHAIRFCIPDANKPGKPKERVAAAAEKLVILVRFCKSHVALTYFKSPNHHMPCMCSSLLAITQIIDTLWPLQINEALNDNPQEGLLDFSMRNEIEQILSVGKRIAGCMAK